MSGDDRNSRTATDLTFVLEQGTTVTVTITAAPIEPVGADRVDDMGNDRRSTPSPGGGVTARRSHPSRTRPVSTPAHVVVGKTATALPRRDEPAEVVPERTAPGEHSPAEQPETGATASVRTSRAPDGGEITVHLTPETAVTAIGDHIVIAYDHSVVLVGDDALLHANTGDAGGGGVVALDAQDSAFTTEPASTDVASTGRGSRVRPIMSFRARPAVDIAGYEDHSVTVRGRHNVVTYDDSNVFVAREGKINANTGDTDSGGLTAMDTLRCNVSAGSHHEDGGDEVDGDEDGGDSDDTTDDQGEAGAGRGPVEPSDSRADEGQETDQGAAPGEALAIGGDGHDDVGFRVEGEDHVVSYDDCNVVIGGTGDVNAQIGDSDTGGTVAMGTVDSEVHGGDSG